MAYENKHSFSYHWKDSINKLLLHIGKQIVICTFQRILETVRIKRHIRVIGGIIKILRGASSAKIPKHGVDLSIVFGDLWDWTSEKNLLIYLRPNDHEETATYLNSQRCNESIVSKKNLLPRRSSRSTKLQRLKLLQRCEQPA